MNQTPSSLLSTLQSPFIHLRSYFDRLSSFTYLNATQFMGALNDNIYKLLTVYFFIQLDGIEASHTVMALTGAVFVIPFLLFSALSGTLADRLSKRDIIVITKILEVVIMALGTIAFALQSKVGCCIILFLLASQSALFGPSKYGIVPELVAREQLSKANGLMTSFTFLAIILGTLLASFFLQITSKNFILCAILCTFLGLIGVVTSFRIEPTPPAGSTGKFKLFFLQQIYNTLRKAKEEPSLLPAMIGSAFFLFIGAFAQFNVIPFAVHSLGLTDVEGGYLFFLTALGIGMGSLLAGKISGKIVELALVPIGGIGIGICAILLDLYSYSLPAVIVFVTALGVFGGLFQVPLDSYIQVASPKQSRGEMFATTNFMSFIGVLAASILLYIVAEVFHLSPSRSFSLIGIIVLIVALAYAFQFFDYLTRFVGSLFSRLHFHTVYIGRENIPECPAVYVCSHTAWNDTLLLLGAQRRRMRFFIEKEQTHSPIMRSLYRLLRVIFIPGVEPLNHGHHSFEDMHAYLKKGFSVCVFIENKRVIEEISKLSQVTPFNTFAVQGGYPLIPVRIEKGESTWRFSWLNQLFKKIRIPATVAFGNMVYEGEVSPFSFRHEHELPTEEE